jgi:hypothetical protein
MRVWGSKEWLTFVGFRGMFSTLADRQIDIYIFDYEVVIFSC